MKWDMPSQVKKLISIDRKSFSMDVLFKSDFNYLQANESGLTNYQYSRNWVRYWVTPAGYIGSSLVGAGLIIAGGTTLGALIGSGIVAAILGTFIHLLLCQPERNHYLFSKEYDSSSSHRLRDCCGRNSLGYSLCGFGS